MPVFAYQAYEASGRKRRGWLEAETIKEARERVANLGLLPEQVYPARAPRSRRGRSEDARAAAYRELSAVLAAGVPLTAGLELLWTSPEMETMRGALSAARDRLREGARPTAALMAGIPGTTPFEEAVLQAGERSGELTRALEQLADYLEERARIRERARSALLYPAVVAGMALIVLVATLGIMTPMMGRLLIEAGLELPPITRAVLWTGRIGMPIALAAACMLGAWFGLRHRRLTAARRARIRLGRPWLGALEGDRVRYTFARALATLLEGGAPMVEAVELASRATGNAWVEEQGLQAAESIRRGASLTQALRAIPPLAEGLTGWTQAGEQSGQLPALLRHAAERFRRAGETRVTRGLALLEPAAILLVGAAVLLIAMAILLPILRVNTAIAP